MLDLDVYRAAAAAALEGGDVYAAHASGSALPFTYPPAAAYLLIPLAFVSRPVAAVGLTGLSVVALIIVVFLVLRRAAAPPFSPTLGVVALLSLLALTLEPVIGTLTLGQLNLILMALIVVDLLTDWRGRGILIGLAAAVKLTPAIFIVYLFSTRRFRAGALAGGVFVVSILAGFAIDGGGSLDYWLRATRAPGFIGGVSFVGNQSLTGALVRLAPGLLPQPGWWWTVVLALAAIAGLAGAALVYRRGREELAVMCCAVTALLVSPISWAHHWVWCAPIAALLLAHCARLFADAGASAWTRSAAGVLPAAAWVLLFYLAPIWLVDDVQGRDLSGLELIVSNLFVIAGVMVVVAAVATVSVRGDGERGRRAGYS